MRPGEVVFIGRKRPRSVWLYLRDGAIVGLLLLAVWVYWTWFPEGGPR